MNTIVILLAAALVTLITIGATLLVGLREAADPIQASTDELTEWEQDLVADERERQVASR